MATYKGSQLSDGTPLNVAVYKAYRNAGLSHSQALAVTAEVGRENSFNAGTLFGNHTDPAASKNGKKIRNLGMLSWNQGRDKMLEGYLVKNGVMKNGVMAKNQANLNAQAAFSVREMKSPRYASKLKNFWGNPNASPDTYARELGKHYIAWAYGQDTIKAQGGGRKAFNWKANDNRRRGYLNTLSGMLGDKTNYASQPQFERPQRTSIAELQAQDKQFARPNRVPISELQAMEQPNAFERPERVPISQLQGAEQPLFERPERIPISQLQATEQAPSVFERPDRVPIAELQTQFARPERVPIEQLQANNELNPMPELEPQQI